MKSFNFLSTSTREKFCNCWHFPTLVKRERRQVIFRLCSKEHEWIYGDRNLCESWLVFHRVRHCYSLHKLLPSLCAYGNTEMLSIHFRWKLLGHRKRFQIKIVLHFIVLAGLSCRSWQIRCPLCFWSKESFNLIEFRKLFVNDFWTFLGTQKVVEKFIFKGLCVWQLHSFFEILRFEIFMWIFMMVHKHNLLELYCVELQNTG